MGQRTFSKHSCPVPLVLNATHYNLSKFILLAQNFNLIRILQHISYQFIIC